jgi:hypothetical protein
LPIEEKLRNNCPKQFLSNLLIPIFMSESLPNPEQKESLKIIAWQYGKPVNLSYIPELKMFMVENRLQDEEDFEFISPKDLLYNSNKNDSTLIRIINNSETYLIVRGLCTNSD